jgi:hypothetical protein
MRTQPAKTGRAPGTGAEHAVMRAIVQDLYGSADRLRPAQIDKPVIAPGEAWDRPGDVAGSFRHLRLEHPLVRPDPATRYAAGNHPLAGPRRHSAIGSRTRS